MRFLVSEKIKCRLVQTFDDGVQFGLEDEQFAILACLLDICIAFQASSVDCKRGFSLMNSIKTKTHNPLETVYLDMLMRIKCFQSLGAQIDQDRVYQQWSSQNNRHEKTLKERFIVEIL